MAAIQRLNEKWIKASVLGTVWASFEIIFGSFLHNLKIPFSGNILTAIGIIILVSVSFIWKEKGLLWRAGLITALMKTISPSAVIFGPMIAIFAEALLLDISIRAFGHSIVGYFVGAALAMSWNLFQRLLNFIIFYGNDIVDLYKNLVIIAQKQIHYVFSSEWIPILIVLIIYILLGIFSAFIGVKIGKKLEEKSIQAINQNSERKNAISINHTLDSNFNYSLAWLFTNILLIIGSLFILSYTPFLVWGLSIIAIVAIWSLRYKRAIRQLAKPKFWIYFVAITMLIAFLFKKENTSFTESIILGIQVNFRAVIMILGFAVLGKELYNPIIQNFFKKSYLRQLSLALNISFESFPSTVANIPDAKTIIKNPINLISQSISEVENKLKEIEEKLQPKIFIVTGAIGEGKTTYIQKISEILEKEDISFNGIYSEKISDNNKTIGYNVVDIQNQTKEKFLHLQGKEHFDKIGKYYIYPEGILKGQEVLNISNINGSQLSIIDEVGLLELQNKGWNHSLNELIKASKTHILLTIRNQFVDEFIREWKLEQTCLYPISEFDYQTIGKSIVETIKD